MDGKCVGHDSVLFVSGTHGLVRKTSGQRLKMGTAMLRDAARWGEMGTQHSSIYLLFTATCFLTKKAVG